MYQDAGNLESVLHLSINSRVMLRRNMCTSFGLINGAIRTVTDIVFNPDEPSMPACIMVNFDNYRGQQTINGSIPIPPVEAKWISNNHECKRL